MCDVSQEPTYVGTFQGAVRQAYKVTCIYYEWKHLSASSLHAHIHIEKRRKNYNNLGPQNRVCMESVWSGCRLPLWCRDTEEAAVWHCELLPTNRTEFWVASFRGPASPISLLLCTKKGKFIPLFSIIASVKSGPITLLNSLVWIKSTFKCYLNCNLLCLLI